MVWIEGQSENGKWWRLKGEMRMVEGEGWRENGGERKVYGTW